MMHLAPDPLKAKVQVVFKVTAQVAHHLQIHARLMLHAVGSQCRPHFCDRVVSKRNAVELDG